MNQNSCVQVLCFDVHLLNIDIEHYSYHVIWVIESPSTESHDVDVVFTENIRIIFSMINIYLSCDLV